MISSDTYKPKMGDYIAIVTTESESIVMIKDVNKNELFLNDNYSDNYICECVILSERNEVISNLNKVVAKQRSSLFQYLSFEDMDCYIKSIILEFEGKCIKDSSNILYKLNHFNGLTHIFSKGVIIV